MRAVSNISPYLLATPNIFIETEPSPLAELPPMITGSMPRDGGHLILAYADAEKLAKAYPETQKLIRPYIGTDELISGNLRRCLWIEDDEIGIANSVPEIVDRLSKVSEMRTSSPLESTRHFRIYPTDLSTWRAKPPRLRLRRLSGPT